MWPTTDSHILECRHRRIQGVCVLPMVLHECGMMAAAAGARWIRTIELFLSPSTTSCGRQIRELTLIGLCSIICEGGFVEETRLCSICCCLMDPRHPGCNTRSFCSKLRSSSNYHGSCMCIRSGRLCQLHVYPGSELSVPPKFRRTSRLPSRRSAIRL